MRTIIRDNYTPEPGDYHDMYVFDEAQGKSWRFDCDGVFYETTIENEYGDSTTTAASQYLVTHTADGIDEKIAEEAALREAADEQLQEEIDDLKNSPDVVDIVATYADLQVYDTSTLGDKDVIRVLVDETHDNESSYYRWDKTNSQWVFIGAVEGYYTKAQTDDLLDEKQDKLTAGSNINIDANNVISGAYTHFTGATASTDGVQGLVPGPLAGDEGKFLQGDGTWGTPTDTTYTAGTNVQISSGNVISATDTTYTAGAGLDLADTTFSVDTTIIQEKLTAGANVSISGNTISATDTTYSDFVGTDGTAAGTAGLVPAPATTDAGKFLKADGTWDTAGSAVNVVQATGTSTTDVMSQNATTKMIFNDPANKRRVNITGGTQSLVDGSVVIGYGAYNGLYAGTGSSGPVVTLGYQAKTYSASNIAIGANSTAGNSTNNTPYNVAIGVGAKAGSTSTAGAYNVAIGPWSTANGKGSIAMGTYSETTNTGEMNIGSTNTTYGYNSSNYRLLTGLYDPQSDHDAATKGYVDTAVAGAGGANTISSQDWSDLWQ